MSSKNNSGAAATSGVNTNGKLPLEENEEEEIWKVAVSRSSPRRRDREEEDDCYGKSSTAARFCRGSYKMLNSNIRASCLWLLVGWARWAFLEARLQTWILEDMKRCSQPLQACRSCASPWKTHLSVLYYYAVYYCLITLSISPTQTRSIAKLSIWRIHTGPYPNAEPFSIRLVCWV